MASLLPVAETVLAGKYRVLRVLGEGAMGAVLEAENVLTLKRVAVKWLKTEAYDSPLRLMREAQAAARVRHPNVVDVYDVAQEGDAIFLVMEYLEGEPLSALLERGGLPVHEMVALLLPALRGVSAAHKQGVIHRDIKPDNIFMARVSDTERPVPKLLDFGISKLEPRGREQLRITTEGLAMGTPMYMSFEQLTGVEDIDARTDVYAFGVLLYEALTGQAPFEAHTLSELAIKIATSEPVPVGELRPGLPRELAQVIARAMARDRSQRTPNIDTLLRELEPFAVAPGAEAPVPPTAWPAPAKGDPAREARAALDARHEPRSRTWWPRLLAGLLALLVAFVLARVTPRRAAHSPAQLVSPRSQAKLPPALPAAHRAAPVVARAVERAADAATSHLPVEPALAPPAGVASHDPPLRAAASAARSRGEARTTMARSRAEASTQSAPPASAPPASTEAAPTPPALQPSAPATRRGHKFRATRQVPRAEDF